MRWEWVGGDIIKSSGIKGILCSTISLDLPWVFLLFNVVLPQAGEYFQGIQTLTGVTR